MPVQNSALNDADRILEADLQKRRKAFKRFYEYCVSIKKWPETKIANFLGLKNSCTRALQEFRGKHNYIATTYLLNKYDELCAREPIHWWLSSAKVKKLNVEQVSKDSESGVQPVQKQFVINRVWFAVDKLFKMRKYQSVLTVGVEMFNEPTTLALLKEHYLHAYFYDMLAVSSRRLNQLTDALLYSGKAIEKHSACDELFAAIRTNQAATYIKQERVRKALKILDDVYQQCPPIAPLFANALIASDKYPKVQEDWLLRLSKASATIQAAVSKALCNSTDAVAQKVFSLLESSEISELKKKED